MSSAAHSGRKFQFLQEIASGGFGSVYLSKMVTPDEDGPPRIVAVKLLHRQWTDNQEVSSRMRDEARLLSRLRHDNIVEVLDFAVIDGRAAIVMEHLEAVDARTIVDHLKANEGRIPLPATFDIAAAVASALDAAYNQAPIGSTRSLRVIHRDIKPSNLMLDALGVVKVLDFGIARADFDAREARTSELAFGSLEYMPPERLFFEPESAASDVYSLGATVFELLVADKLGKAKLRPAEHDQFLNDRLRELVGRYSPGAITAELLELLRGMLAFDEVQRPTAAEVRSKMLVLARSGGTPTLAEWAAEKVPPLLERHRSQHEGGGTLVGQVLTEGPMVSPSEFEPVQTEIADLSSLASLIRDPSMFATPQAQGPERRAYGPDDGSTIRDDTRWAELKQVALGESPPPSGRRNQSPGGVYQAMVEPNPPNRPQNPLEWLGDDDEIEGAPTVRMGADDRWRLLGSDELQPPSTYDDRQVDDREVDVVTVITPPGAEARAPGPTSHAGSPPIIVVTPNESSTATVAYAVTALMLFSTSVLILVAVLMVGGVGVVALSYPRRVARSEPSQVEPPLGAAPTTSGAPTPVPTSGAAGAAAGAAAAAAGPGVTFTSRMADTRRIMARCDGVSGVGADQVVLPGAVRPGRPLFGECTVTAVDTDRKRRTAVISAVEARAYVCFAGEDSNCQ